MLDSAERGTLVKFYGPSATALCSDTPGGYADEGEAEEAQDAQARAPDGHGNHGGQAHEAPAHAGAGRAGGPRGGELTSCHSWHK